MIQTIKNKDSVHEEDECILCGKKQSADTRHDFLRECYMIGQDGKWDKGLYQPQLNFIEIGKLKFGFNNICSNRTRCRKRISENLKNKSDVFQSQKAV